MSTAPFQTYDDAAVIPSVEDGRPKFRKDYIGRDSEVQVGGAEAFLVQVLSGNTVRAHYHPVDQFQVLFGDGEATYKGKLVPRVLVHYTDANTTYGPFAAGPSKTLQFFTLRDAVTRVTEFMPEGRDKLPPATERRNHFLSDADAVLDGPLPEHGQTRSDVLFSDDRSAVAAFVLHGGPDTAVDLGPASDPGRYHVVLEGSVTDETGKEFGTMSVGWAGVGDDAPIYRTGSAGCRILGLQFAAMMER